MQKLPESNYTRFMSYLDTKKGPYYSPYFWERSKYLSILLILSKPIYKFINTYDPDFLNDLLSLGYYFLFPLCVRNLVTISNRTSRYLIVGVLVAIISIIFLYDLKIITYNPLAFLDTVNPIILKCLIRTTVLGGLLIEFILIFRKDMQRFINSSKKL